MSSSLCSLRSSTCNTLIALAAAAGISRFVPAPGKPVAARAAVSAAASHVSLLPARVRAVRAAFAALVPLPGISRLNVVPARPDGISPAPGAHRRPRLRPANKRRHDPGSRRNLLPAPATSTQTSLSFINPAAMFAINAENLSDEDYLLAGSTGLAFSPVNPRSYALRVSYSW